MDFDTSERLASYINPAVTTTRSEWSAIAKGNSVALANLQARSGDRSFSMGSRQHRSFPVRKVESAILDAMMLAKSLGDAEVSNKLLRAWTELEAGRSERARAAGAKTHGNVFLAVSLPSGKWAVKWSSTRARNGALFGEFATEAEAAASALELTGTERLDRA